MANTGIRDRHPANNTYERFNGEIWDRIARIRGFKSRNPALLVLLVTYHNFMRPHGGLGGRIPAEAAGITITGPDKWRTIIGQRRCSARSACFQSCLNTDRRVQVGSLGNAG